MQITTNTIWDIAKNVFQVHGIDAAEKVVVRRAASPRSGDEVLRGVAALRGWHGGLCASRRRSPLHDPKARSDIELVVDYAPKM